MAAVKSGINKVGDSYYQSITIDQPDGTIGTTMYRVNADGSGGVPIYDVDKPAGSTEFIKSFDANATEAEKQQLSDPNSQLSQVRSQQITSSNPYGDEPTAEQKQEINGAAGKPNEATNTEQGDPQQSTKETQGKDAGASQENNSFKAGTRTKYPDVYYPENLSLQDQDCIKFSILEYQPSLASAVNSTGSISSDVGRPKGKKILGSITLPIPAGINDNNTVNWQSDELNLLQEAGAKVATNTLANGKEGTEEATKSILGRFEASTKSGELKKGLEGLVGGMAVNKNTVAQRALGSIFNNNLELLFNGPSLRSFSFTFKLSPRNPNEAKKVMTIIRYFKQAMSVKRSQTSLLLKTPRTFAISYLTSNKEHPYLNKFKECALTNFSVDYTPEGQYMTYMSSSIDGRSMISYNISLQFQELEPVFDDEYGSDAITNIGY